MKVNLSYIYIRETNCLIENYIMYMKFINSDTCVYDIYYSNSKVNYNQGCLKKSRCHD